MIRRLYPWETGDVIPIAQAFHAEAALGGGFSAEVLGQSLQNLMTKGSLFACGQFHEGRLVGALVGLVGPHLMCEVTIAQELFWYVLPDHRRGSDTLRMVKDFEAWARERGAYACIMATFHAADAEKRLPAIFERLGFGAIETHHFKHL